MLGVQELPPSLRLWKWRARTDNIFRMLRLHRSSIQTLQREIVRAYYGQVERDSFYEKMLQDIVSLIFQVSEIDGLYEAIQILNTGHLPHQIINHEQFKRSLNDLQVQICEHHPYLVVQPDVKYYYEQARPKIFSNRTTSAEKNDVSF